MCGIIGFVGNEFAAEHILSGLFALEYRGYDSAGAAIGNEKGFEIIKCQGRVSALRELFKLKKPDGNVGIGHTRWATHGEPSERNAHPHSSDKVILVHNGIIENYLSLKEELISIGYSFKSETDTECIAHLIDREYKASGGAVLSIKRAAEKLRGSFALAIIFKDRPNEIWAIRRNNPLVAAKSEIGVHLASDIPAILPYTKNIIRPEDDEILCLKSQCITLFDKEGNERKIETEHIAWDYEMAKKDGYAHFMLKEINEEPDAVIKAVSSNLDDNGVPNLSNIGISSELLSSFDSLSVIACGSAYHAGIVGKYIVERLAKIPVFVTLASEYRTDPPIEAKNPLVIPISQSGETADTLGALRLAKGLLKTSLGIINTVGSAIARECDYVMYTNAGPEISVATTKGYITQVVSLCLVAIEMAKANGRLSHTDAAALASVLTSEIPKEIMKVIARYDEIARLALEIKDKNDLYYIGRGVDYAAALESSLKLKEVSYIHSEAYAAGELKHGTLSLITEGTPVIAISCDKKYHEKMIGNIREVASRGGRVILVCTEDFENPQAYAERVFILPSLDGVFMPLLSVVFSQLLAYETARLRGCDIDCPRNLAKSVTVE